MKEDEFSGLATKYGKATENLKKLKDKLDGDDGYEPKTFEYARKVLKAATDDLGRLARVAKDGGDLPKELEKQLTGVITMALNIISMEQNEIPAK